MARILSLEEETIKKKQADPSTSSSTTTSTTAAAATASVTTASSNNHQLHPQGNMTSNSSSSVRLFSLGLFFVFYLAMGASIFSAIESPIEKDEMDRLRQKKQDFLQKYDCITDSSLDDLIEEIVNANNRGVSLEKNGSAVPSWSFGQSFFFSSTVVTTIGYGHQTPLSPEGKSFCIIYGLIGIPMTMLLVTAVVERLMVPVNLLLIWLNNTMGHLYSPFSLRLFHLGLILLAIVITLFVIPAAVFTGLEPNWNYLDSMYYCFISLTTVGLGDFIPGDTPGQHLRPLYKACTTFYLLLGVTGMMLLLTVFYNIPEFDISHFFLMSCSSGKLNGVGNMSNLNGQSEPNQSANYEDPERIRLQPPGAQGPKYTQQINETNELGHSRTIVRARSRPDDDDDDEGPAPGPSGRARLR